MSFLTDCIKRSLLRTNRFYGTLERLKVVTYQDKIKWRLPHYRQRVLFDQEGQDRVGALIDRNAPLMISRMGSVELSCLRFYLEKRGARKTAYSKKIRFPMSNNAGFFPADDRSLDAFSELILAQLPQADVMGVWFNHYEE
jgi:hypothetical protein